MTTLLTVAGLMRAVYFGMLLSAFHASDGVACVEFGITGSGWGAGRDTALFVHDVFYPLMLIGLAAMGLYFLDTSAAVASNALARLKSITFLTRNTLVAFVVLDAALLAVLIGVNFGLLSNDSTATAPVAYLVLATTAAACLGEGFVMGYFGGKLAAAASSNTGAPSGSVPTSEQQNRSSLRKSSSSNFFRGRRGTRSQQPSGASNNDARNSGRIQSSSRGAAGGEGSGVVRESAPSSQGAGPTAAPTGTAANRGFSSRDSRRFNFSQDAGSERGSRRISSQPGGGLRSRSSSRFSFKRSRSGESTGKASNKVAVLVRSSVALLVGVGLLLIVRTVPQLSSSALVLMVSYSLLLHVWEIVGVAAVLGLIPQAAEQKRVAMLISMSSGSFSESRRWKWPAWMGDAPGATLGGAAMTFFRRRHSSDSEIGAVPQVVIPKQDRFDFAAAMGSRASRRSSATSSEYKSPDSGKERARSSAIEMSTLEPVEEVAEKEARPTFDMGNPLRADDAPGLEDGASAHADQGVTGHVEIYSTTSVNEALRRARSSSAAAAEPQVVEVDTDAMADEEGGDAVEDGAREDAV